MGAKSSYLPSVDTTWPHTLNKRVRHVVGANGGAIIGEEDFLLDHADYAKTLDTIKTSGTEVVFNTIISRA